MNNQDLQRQIDELRTELDNLKRSSSIDRDIETAFDERLGVSLKLKATATGSASTQSILIAGTPQTITVPAQPSGTLTVTYNGTTYNLLYK